MKLMVTGFEICIAGDPATDPRGPRRVAWAGYASKRGAVMSVTDDEKAAALALIGRASANADALDAIRRELSGREWSADTLDAIAAIVRGTGRVIEGVR